MGDIYIDGIHIKVTYDDKNNQIISVGDSQISVDPDIVSKAWVLYESGRYDLIKPKASCRTQMWIKSIYNYIVSNKNQPNIVLISLLLSV